MAFNIRSRLTLRMAGAALLCGILLPFPSAFADVIQLTSASSLSLGDTTFTYPNSLLGQTGSQSYQPTIGNQTLTFTGLLFTFYEAGVTYGNTGFPYGTNIMQTGGYSSPIPFLNLYFSAPVSEIGFNLEQYAPGNETFYVSVGGPNGGASYTITGNDPNSLAFFGVEGTNGQTFTSVSIQDSIDSDIVVGPITFGDPARSTPTPEPGTFVLLTSGLAVIGAFRRKLVRR